MFLVFAGIGCLLSNRVLICVMEENFPEIPSGLESMLLSRQASPGLLAEALVKEYFQPIYHIAASLLDDEDVAWHAAIKTMRQAISKAPSYRIEKGVKLWIYGIALKVCWDQTNSLKIRPSLVSIIRSPYTPYHMRPSVPRDETDETVWQTADVFSYKTRWLVLFHFVHGWSKADLSRLFGESEREIQERLEIACKNFFRALGRPGCAGGDPEAKNQEGLVQASLRRRWPQPNFTPTELERITSIVKEGIDDRLRFQTRLKAYRETLWVGIITLLAVGLIWGANRLLVEPLARPKPALPRPVSQAKTAVPSPTLALTITPSREEREKILFDAIGNAAVEGHEDAAQQTPTLSPRLKLDYEIGYLTRPGDTLRAIAVRMSLNVKNLVAANNLAPDEQLKGGTYVGLTEGAQLDQAGPAELSSRFSPHLPLLDRKSSSEDIYRALLLSDRTWSSLWADVQIVEYGPPGYVGPPFAIRDQLWIRQPVQSKEMIGPYTGEPSYLFLTTLGYSFLFYPEFGTKLLRDAQELLSGSALEELIYPGKAGWIGTEGDFQIKGQETVSGREALRIDKFDPEAGRLYRLWVDQRRGVVLRLQKYGGDGLRTLLEEKSILSLVYDTDIPDKLFDPNRYYLAGFARDYTGRLQKAGDTLSVPAFAEGPGHAPFPSTTEPAPEEVDFRNSRLQFVVPGEAPVNSESQPLPKGIDVFAGQNYLGSIELPNLWGLKCVRSPDGKRMAFTRLLQWFDFGLSRVSDHSIGLRWVDLNSLSNVRTVLDESLILDMAFAPDSRRLALFLYGPPIPAVYILDTSSGKSEKLIDLFYASNLVWNKQGSQLALLGVEDQFLDPEAMVLNIQTGEVLHRAPVDPSGRQKQFFYEGRRNWIASNILYTDWRVDFQDLWLGFEACTALPGQ